MFGSSNHEFRTNYRTRGAVIFLLHIGWNESKNRRKCSSLMSILNVCSYVDSWIWTRFCRSTLIESFIVDEPFVEVEETQTRVGSGGRSSRVLQGTANSTVIASDRCPSTNPVEKLLSTVLLRLPTTPFSLLIEFFQQSRWNDKSKIERIENKNNSSIL